MLAAVSLVACNSDSGSDSEATAAPAASPETSTAATEPTAAAATDDGNAGEAAADEPVGGGTAAQVRSITVGGMGAEYAPPVRSIVNLGVSVRRTSVEEASEAAAIAAAYVLGAVEAAGVPSSGIQMSDFGINPAYDTFNYQVVTGYTVNMGYNVTFPDVDAVGSVLGAAIAAGGDDVRAYGVRFEPDPAALMDGARTKAWEDVRARAAATAELAGEPLGEVLDVHEKVLITTPQGMVQGGEGDSATFDIPVAPGTAGVTVLLTVTYAIGA
ncbi:MAG: SIMPL domain-containing protein [Acidimicrobiia bacterium]